MATTFRRPIARRPTRQGVDPGVWLISASVAAWLVLIAAEIFADGPLEAAHRGDPAAHGAHTDMSAMHHGGARAVVVSAPAWWPWIGMWTVMVVAMMWPLLIAAAREVSAATYRRWRAPSVASQVFASSAMWVAVGVAAYALWDVVPDVVSTWWWAPALLVLAAGLTLSPPRARLLRSCRASSLIAPGGRSALASAAVSGSREWPRCALLCGPVMVAMVATHSVVVMAAASVGVWWEQRHPRAWPDPVPATALVVAAIAALITST